MRKPAPWPLRYGLAVLVTALAVGFRFIPVVGQGFGSALFLAILISAWYGGFGPGLVSTIIPAVLAVVGMVFWQPTFEIWRAVGAALFVGGGVLISLLVEALHESRRRSESSEAWLAAVLRSIGDAVIAADSQGRVQFVNSVAASLTGWNDKEARGLPLRKIFQIINEHTRAPAENPVERVIREGTVLGLANHTLLVGRNGVETPIDDSAAPIKNEQGRVEGVVLVFRDVTERKEAERDREMLLARAESARADAEAASQAKDQFLAVLSHELRTPLTPVLLTVSALLEHPDTPTDLRATLEMTRQNVELEARLIDDLLDVARIIRGNMPLRKEVVDAHELLQRAVAICRDDFAVQDLKLELDLTASHHYLSGDPVRIQQVFWNLIKNAVKFTPQRGRVRLHTTNDEAGKALVLEVTDTGVGIEAERLASIFDAFAQGSESTWSRPFGGLGLGLAISRSLVEAHSGKLSVTSDGKDQGSTFRLELPTVPAPEHQAMLPLVEPRHIGPARRLRILLVEDDEPTLRVMSRLLRQRDYDVTTAASVAAGLEAGSQEDFDLVISDLALPDGNGLELMRRLKALRGFRGIALTGFGMESDISKAREAGFSEHLTKPVDFQTLDAVIQRIAP